MSSTLGRLSRPRSSDGAPRAAPVKAAAVFKTSRRDRLLAEAGLPGLDRGSEVMGKISVRTVHWTASRAKSLDVSRTSEIMNRTVYSLVPWLLLCFLPGYANPSSVGTVIDVGSKKQLFIDDLFVASWNGVRLTVNPPHKTRERNLVPDPDRPWEALRVAYPCTVMEDRGKYRMWYDAMYDRQPEDQLPYRLVCYAESDDGIDWRKPIVGAYAFRGSKRNNISIPTAPGSVFIDPNAPPEERYKYFGRNRVAMLEDRVAGAGSWIYASADGLSFKPLYGRPATRQISDTHDVAFWDPAIGRYVAYTKYIGHFDSQGALVRPELPTGVRKGRKIWRMTTERLDRWPEAKVVLAMDAGTPGTPTSTTPPQSATRTPIGPISSFPAPTTTSWASRRGATTAPWTFNWQ